MATERNGINSSNILEVIIDIFIIILIVIFMATLIIIVVVLSNLVMMMRWYLLPPLTLDSHLDIIRRQYEVSRLLLSPFQSCQKDILVSWIRCKHLTDF